MYLFLKGYFIKPWIIQLHIPIRTQFQLYILCSSLLLHKIHPNSRKSATILNLQEHGNRSQSLKCYTFSFKITCRECVVGNKIPRSLFIITHSVLDVLGNLMIFCHMLPLHNLFVCLFECVLGYRFICLHLDICFNCHLN